MQLTVQPRHGIAQPVHSPLPRCVKYGPVWETVRHPYRTVSHTLMRFASRQHLLIAAERRKHVAAGDGTPAHLSDRERHDVLYRQVLPARIAPHGRS